MDSNRFDALTRVLSSRRTALTGALGGLAVLGLPGADEAAAHDPRRACRNIPDPVKRRKCLARARRHNRQQHSCKPQPIAVTCGGRCGRKQNNCRKAVNCTCPAGKLCMANTTCSRFCGPPTFTCPAGCICVGQPVETPGVLHCIPSGTACNNVPQVCATTANCPVGQICSAAACSGQNRCVPICSI